MVGCMGFALNKCSMFFFGIHKLTIVIHYDKPSINEMQSHEVLVKPGALSIIVSK